MIRIMDKTNRVTDRMMMPLRDLKNNMHFIRCAGICFVNNPKPRIPFFNMNECRTDIKSR